MDKKALRAKAHQPKPKKKLIRTKRDINRIRIISVIAVLVIFAIVYYIVDSQSYVATIDGNRISEAEFRYFLSQQVAYTEYEEELTTQEDKDKFWTTLADGQDPWEEAKIKALDLAKEYSIQSIKAKESGLKVNSEIKNEVVYLLTSMQKQMTDKQFTEYIHEMYGIKPKQLQSIWENYSVIERYKNSYIADNYTVEPVTDDEIKSYYQENIKAFDKVDISYVTFYKYNKENYEDLTEQEIEDKKNIAQEALNKIQSGESMDLIITEYTEEEKLENSDEKSEEDELPLGKSTLQYSEGNSLIDWVFGNKPGDCGIVETDYVIYVVKIDDRSTFDDVKAEVKTTLEKENREKFYDDVLDEWSLDSKYNILKNEPVYESISYK